LENDYVWDNVPGGHIPSIVVRPRNQVNPGFCGEWIVSFHEVSFG
jgi:hypothetical protein